jgi:hypothetical protein
MNRRQRLTDQAVLRLLEVAMPNAESIALQQRLGVSSLTVEAHCSFLAVLPCAADDDLFDYDPTGQPCAVVGVHRHDERLADALAWPLGAPDHPRRHLGLAPLIGAVWPPQGHPLRVHEHVEAWLADHCEGTVPLDENGVELIAGHDGPLVANDIEHGRWLREMLAPFGRGGDVVVPRAALEVAA